MGFSEVITYSSATALNFDSTKVAVSAGALTLLAPSPYTTTNPRVTSQHQNTISSLTSFAESSTLPASTAIQYQLVLNALPYWYNATNSTWASSDGTYTQSNTAAVINSNASTLFSQLSLLSPQFLGLNIFLHTSNTSNAPILATNTIGYGFTNSNASAMNQCLISAYLSDLAGGTIVPTAAQPVQLLVTAPYGFMHGTNFIKPFTKAFSVDSNGYLSASVIETATPGVPLEFSLTYYDGNSLKSTRLFNAVVPNSPSISLTNLSTVVRYDVG